MTPPASASLREQIAALRSLLERAHLYVNRLAGNLEVAAPESPQGERADSHTLVPLPGAAASHQHDYRHYEVCAICGLTEAAIKGCHHCGDAESIRHGRCWWCLRPRAAEERPQPEEVIEIDENGRVSRPVRGPIRESGAAPTGAPEEPK